MRDEAMTSRDRRILLLGTGAVVVGIALAGSIAKTGGGVLILVGWLVILGALHRLGRSG